MGESGGGGLAACVALMARDRDRQVYPPIAKQILVYPMLDDRTAVAHTPEIDRLGIWTAADNVTAWGTLLGEHQARDGVSCYAAAARAYSLAGLPSTYLDVGSLDVFSG
jgi:acetyl esterase/lipase